MRYFLDTNACIALLNNKPTQVRHRFRLAAESGAEIGVSTIVSFELWYGAANSKRYEKNAERLDLFFSGPLELVPFDDEDAREAGRIRAELENLGTPIGAYDVLIEGQALRYGATLVTANVSEFSRVRHLQWEDWGKPE